MYWHENFTRYRGRSEGGGHNSPGAEKFQQCHKYFLQHRRFAFLKTSGPNMGAPNLLLAPAAT